MKLKVMISVLFIIISIMSIGLFINAQGTVAFQPCFDLVTSNLNSISASQDNIVAVGENGIVKISGDGKQWSCAFSGLSNNYSLRSIINTKSQFIAVGSITGKDSKGIILTASNSNAFNWSSFKEYDYSFNDISYYDNIFCLTANKGKFLVGTLDNLKEYSLNGEYNASIVTDTNLFVAVGNKGQISVFSPQRNIDLTPRNNPVNSSIKLTDIAFNVNSKVCIAVGENGTIVKSDDYTNNYNTWVTVQLKENNKCNFTSISKIEGEEKFIACGNDGKYTYFYYFDRNGNQIDRWSYSLQNVNGVTSFRGQDIAVGKNGCILNRYSANDTKEIINKSNSEVIGLLWNENKGVYIASTTDDTSKKSKAIAFKIIANQPKIVDIYNINKPISAILYNKDRDEYVISTYDGVKYIEKSLSNSNQWKPKSTKNNATEQFRSIAYGNNKYVFVGGNADETPGISKGKEFIEIYNVQASKWDKVLDLNGLENVTFGNGKFVATSKAKGIFTSQDGLTWKKVSSFSALNISWSRGKFYAGGENGEIFISPNANTWEKKNVNINSKVFAILGYLDETIIVGSQGTIIYSDNDNDFIVGEIIDSIFGGKYTLNNNINFIATSSEDFVCMADNGMVFTKKIKQPEVTINSIKIQYKDKPYLDEKNRLYLPIEETITYLRLEYKYNPSNGSITVTDLPKNIVYGKNDIIIKNYVKYISFDRFKDLLNSTSYKYNYDAKLRKLEIRG